MRFFCRIFTFVTCCLFISCREETVILNSLSHFTPTSEDLKASLSLNLKETYKIEMKVLQELWDREKVKNRIADLTAKNIFISSQIRRKNEELISLLERSQSEYSSNEKKEVLNEVLSLTQKYKFITASHGEERLKEQEIGFCFLKALIAHYLLIKYDISNQKIRKIFALGPLLANNMVWKFHVAALVIDRDRILIIDPLFSEPLDLKNWIRSVEELSAEKPYPRLRFYITDPRKFLPDSGQYNENDIMHPKIKKYSRELLEYFENFKK